QHALLPPRHLARRTAGEPPGHLAVPGPGRLGRLSARAARQAGLPRLRQRPFRAEGRQFRLPPGQGEAVGRPLRPERLNAGPSAGVRVPPGSRGRRGRPRQAVPSSAWSWRKTLTCCARLSRPAAAGAPGDLSCTPTPPVHSRRAVHSSSTRSWTWTSTWVRAASRPAAYTTAVARRSG